MTFSCGLDKSRTVFSISSRQGWIRGRITKTSQLVNAGRAVLPLRFIDPSELTPYEDSNAMAIHMASTELLKLVFCSPSDTIMIHSALLAGRDTTDPFDGVRDIIYGMMTTFVNDPEVGRDNNMPSPVLIVVLV